MRDGWVRRALKRLTLAVVTVDVWWRRRWLARHGEPHFVLTGTCNGCGRCCEAPSLQVGRATFRAGPLRALVLWWQRVVNGFALVSEDPRFHVFVFRCSHYDAQSKRCDSYDSRPAMCRDYPVNLTYEAAPALFPECSHAVRAKNAEGLRAALEASGLSKEKLAELEDKLHLR